MVTHIAPPRLIVVAPKRQEQAILFINWSNKWSKQWTESLWFCCFLFLLMVLLIGLLWEQTGVPNTADGILHLHRSAAVARSWEVAVQWPRWFPEVYQGLGAPVFHFYAPLFYVLVAAFHRLTIPLAVSAKLVITLMFLLSGLATRAWLSRLLTPTAGLVAAILYVSQPLLFREYFFQGNYPQLIALFWLPVVLWSFTRLADESHWLNWILAPASLVILMVAHNITAMLGGAVIAVFWMALSIYKRSWGVGWRGIGALLYGIGLSAFFWMPALGDMDLVQIQGAQDGFFHYSQHFLSWRELLAPPPLLDSRAANPPFPHQVGWAALATLTTTTLALALHLWRRRTYPKEIYWTGVGILFVFSTLALTLPSSQWLWDRLPALHVLQFPSRLLGVTAIGIALAVGGGATIWRGRSEWLLIAVTVLAVGFGNAVFLFPRQPFVPISSISGEQTLEYERNSRVWGMTGSNEFLPRWATLPELNAAENLWIEYLGSEITWEWQTPHQLRVASHNGTIPLRNQTVVLPLHYFPAWSAKVDGRPVPIRPSANGLLLLETESAVHEIVVRWHGTFWQILGERISGVAAIFWLVWIGWSIFHSRQITANESEGQDLKSYRISTPQIGLLLLLLFLLGARYLISWSDAGWFQRHSPLMSVDGVAHSTSVTLTDSRQTEILLLGWEQITSGPLLPGNKIHLRLYWQAVDPTPQNLQSFVHIYSPEIKHSWAISQNLHPGYIATSGWAPALYYVDDIYISVPVDMAPIQTTLVAGLMNEQGERLQSPDNSDGLVHLTDITIAPISSSQTKLEPTVAAPARFGKQLDLTGYDLLPAPGGPILRLYWNVYDQLPTDLVLFIHLIDQQNSMVAQFDRSPLKGVLSTSQWPVGSLIIDEHYLNLPAELSPGNYKFIVGWYDPISGIRLAVQPGEEIAANFFPDALVVSLHVPVP
jgi:hypothetical protein